MLTRTSGPLALSAISRRRRVCASRCSSLGAIAVQRPSKPASLGLSSEKGTPPPELTPSP